MLAAAAAMFAYGLSAARIKEGWSISAALAARNVWLCPGLCPWLAGRRLRGGYCTELLLALLDPN